MAAAVALASCGSSSTNEVSASDTAPVLISVPGISSAVTYSFDLGAIDTATGMYYVTDRTNKAVDVINISGGAANVLNTPVTLFKQAYAGCNSGGTSGGATKFPYVPMPGCLNIAITANNTLVTNNDLDGPDGLDIVGPNLFVGDVNNLWVINKTTGALVGKVAIPNTGTQQGFRSDEGCYDPVNHLYATALTGDPNSPFMTILDTTAHDADATGLTMPVVIAKLLMNDSAGAPSAGIEACFFDTRQATTTGAANTTVTAGFLWLNNDGSTANPNGEADGIPIGDLVAIRNTPLAGLKKIVFDGPLTATNDFNAATTSAPICKLGTAPCGTVLPKVIALPAKCDATGIAAGPAAGFEAGAMCRPGTFGQSLDFVIINTGGPTVTAGSVVTTVVGAGGGDQVAYDAASNRYYLANSRATANKKSCFSGGVQACNLTPKLTVVDGTTHAVVGNFDSGNNAHSVAVGLGMVLMPFAATSATAGGAFFPNGGVALYPTM
jgi:hypothetical protein